MPENKTGAEAEAKASPEIEHKANVEEEDKAAPDIEDQGGAETGDEASVEVENEAPAEAGFGQVAQVSAGSTISLDQRDTSPDEHEIRRRRELIRALFNDFWQGNDDKPVTFADRLDQAETYLNERLIADGEPWRLDATTRKMLGLPPRAH